MTCGLSSHLRFRSTHLDSGNQQEFYSAIKVAYGPRTRAGCPMRSADGVSLIISAQAEILARWAEHYQELLNKNTPADTEFTRSLPQLPILEGMDEVPSLQEVHSAINSLKSNKAPGPDSVPSEALCHGGPAVEKVLHAFIEASWKNGSVPQQWKDADQISVYKKKGDRSICGNSSGITLLSCAGKVLTKIMLSRLIAAVSEEVLPERQCGFRKNRGTVDMVFPLGQVQEKCIEQHTEL